MMMADMTAANDTNKRPYRCALPRELPTALAHCRFRLASVQLRFLTVHDHEINKPTYWIGYCD